MPLIDNLRAALTIHLTTYMHWLLNENPPDDFAYELRLILLHIVEQGTDLHEVMMACVPVGNDFIAPDLMRGAINYHRDLLVDYETKKFKKRVEAAEETAKFLLTLDEKENKRLESIKIRLAQQAKSPASTKPENTKTKPSSLQHYFSRAQYFSRNLRITEARSMYEQAYITAVKMNDLRTRFDALDGQLFLTGKTLAKKAKTIRTSLIARLASFSKDKPNEKMDKLGTLILETDAEMRELSKLHTLYNSLTHHTDITTNDEISRGITISRELISELINEIKATLDESDALFQHLKNMQKERRHNHILRLGKGDFNQGLVLFKSMGKGKEAVSSYTKEMRDTESLAKQFGAIHSAASSILEHYKSHKQSQIKLTESFRAIFHSVQSVPGKFYVVGSNAVSLLSSQENSQPFNLSDIDLVGFNIDEQALIEKKFQHSPYHPWLYQKNNMDAMLSQKTSLLEDAQTRDFTVCAVYIDEQGVAHDPLGTGIDDIANKHLRMIDDPLDRLQKDPIIALRAMRYTAAGYKPDQILCDALKTFSLPENYQKDHLFAVARKHLQHLDRKQYIGLLQEHGLLEKLFGIRSNENNLNIALWKLEKLINVSTLKRNKYTPIFAHTDKDYAKLSSDVAENPRLADYAYEMKNVDPQKRLAMQALNL